MLGDYKNNPPPTTRAFKDIDSVIVNFGRLICKNK